MFSWISNRNKTKQQKSKGVRGKDFSIAENGLEPEPAVKSAQPQDRVTVAEPVEAITEERLERRFPQEEPDSGGMNPGLPGGDGQTPYTGEVELAIAAPVDLKMVSQLYETLQTIRELKILHTSGSANRGTVITVVLESPMPLISMISSRMSGVELTPELPGNRGSVDGKWNSLPGKEKKELRRIKLVVH